MYKKLYQIGKQLPKRDRFGVHAHIENTTLKCLMLSIQSALATKQEKVKLIRRLQIQLETVKHLVRLEHELELLPRKTYWELAEQLRELSRQTASWYNYAKRPR